MIIVKSGSGLSKAMKLDSIHLEWQKTQSVPRPFLYQRNHSYTPDTNYNDNNKTVSDDNDNALQDMEMKVTGSFSTDEGNVSSYQSIHTQLQWTTAYRKGESCVSACHALYTYTNNGDQIPMMCHEEALNSVQDAESIIIAANAAQRRCMGEPEQLQNPKSDKSSITNNNNNENQFYALTPYINKGEKTCYYTTRSRNDSLADDTLKCDTSVAAGRERLCPCIARFGLKKVLSSVRHLYNSALEYQNAYALLSKQNMYEYCFRPEEFDDNGFNASTSDHATSDGNNEFIDKVFCNIRKLYHEEGQLYEAYESLKALPIEFNFTIDSLLQKNRWIWRRSLALEDLFDRDNQKHDDDDEEVSHDTTSKSHDNALDDNNHIHTYEYDELPQYKAPVEYGKSRLKSRVLCGHYEYRSFKFLSNKTTTPTTTTNIEMRWADETFELPIMRDWYENDSKSDESIGKVPAFNGIGLYIIEAEENSISEEWSDVQRANQEAAASVVKNMKMNTHEGAKLLKESIETLPSSSGWNQNIDEGKQKMERLSFLLSAELLDADGFHHSIHTPLNMSEGIDFYISRLNVSIVDLQSDSAEETVEYNDLMIPLVFNRYHQSEKALFVTSFKGWGGQLNDKTQILATLNADMSSFIDMLLTIDEEDNGKKMRDESRSEGRKISISHVTIVMQQNMNIINLEQQYESSSGRVLNVFDIALCDPNTFHINGNKHVDNTISIGISKHLYNTYDPHMENVETKLWWQKHLFTFIEYYQKVHNINRFYLYGESDSYRELLTEYIQAGIVQYIDWPYSADIGEGSILEGNKRIGNILGHGYGSRPDKVLHVSQTTILYYYYTDSIVVIVVVVLSSMACIFSFMYMFRIEV